MVGSTYVSDPRIWKSFYTNMIDGKFNPGHYQGRQTGGGIANMYAKKPYMVPVNPHVTIKPEEKVVVGNKVTPVAAMEERAKSQLKNAIKGDMPHVPLTIKGKTPKIPVSLKRPAKKISSANQKKYKNKSLYIPVVKADKIKARSVKNKKKKATKEKGKTNAHQQRRSGPLQEEEEDTIFAKKWRI